MLPIDNNSITPSLIGRGGPAIVLAMDFNTSPIPLNPPSPLEKGLVFIHIIYVHNNNRAREISDKPWPEQ